MSVCQTYLVQMNSGISGVSLVEKAGRKTPSYYSEKEEKDDAFDALKFGISTLYVTFDFEKEKIITQRKDIGKNNGEKQYIDSCILYQDQFYMFYVTLNGCNCQNIKKDGRIYRIKIEQK